MKKLTASDYRISDWSGGKTIQIAIAPEDALYADRTFIWRLSSATVDLDESEFTSLPDYLRFIAPLSGEMELTHNGGDPVMLAPYEVHRFDGADSTHSRGRCTDFNLMLRKGVCDGSISGLRADRDTVQTFLPEPDAETVIIYCAEGSVSVSCGEESAELTEREALLLEGGAIGPLKIAFQEGTGAMCAQIRRIR